jgi:Tol biopolymer transport system component
MRRREFVLAAGAMALSPFWKTKAQSSLGTLTWIESGSLWIRELPDGQAVKVTSAEGFDSPRFSPSGRWIVLRDKDGNEWLVKRDGQAGGALENPRSLLSGEDLALLRPKEAFAPDGHRYVFSRVLPDTRVLPDDEAPRPTGQLCLASLAEPDRELEVLVSDDQGEKQVFGWTRDGKSVIYWDADEWGVSTWCDGVALKSVDVERGIIQDLHVSVLADEDMLDLAPASAGNKLAVSDGEHRETWAGKHVAIVDLDTGGSRYFLPDDVASMCPAWSPDGKRIACFAAPDADIAYLRAHAGETYKLVNPDGTETTETVKPGDNFDIGGGEEAHVYLQQRKIWLLDPEGSNPPRQLTSDYRYRDEEPMWSADSSYILFGRMDYQGHASLWLMDANGAGAMQACRLSVADPSTGQDEDTWFGYYGYTDWRKYFDWRR